MAILKIRNKDGVMVPVPAIVGPQGPSGNSGVYVGSGDMPEGYNVQIDPDGESSDIVTRYEFSNLSDTVNNLIENGVTGHTPVKGTDYWTEADKAEIKTYVDEAILGGEW